MMTPEERATQALKPLVHDSSPCDYDSALENVTAAIREAVAGEREAIAVITDRWACTYGGIVGEMFGQLAEVIRARGKR